MTSRINGLGLAAALCALNIVIATEATAAEDASAWDGDGRSAARLIAGAAPTQKDSPARAGIEIRLTRGWHTYWRYPGDSGMPPQFEFAGSRNLKHFEVLWPAPERIAEGGSTSIGYWTNVIFPLRVIPADPSKPVSLRLRLNYAICEKMCVPAQGRGELTLPPRRSSQDGALGRAEARVPKKQHVGEKAGLSILSVRREPGGEGKPRVLVDVAGPAGVDLFVEGPNPQWALPVPSAMEVASAGLHRFVFELDGAPAGEAYDGAMLTLTAVTRTGAIEVTTRLD